MSLRHQVGAFAVLQSRIAGYMENRLRHPKIEVQLSYARVPNNSRLSYLLRQICSGLGYS